jgi:membrane protease YdiL (CAAX protease family)
MNGFLTSRPYLIAEFIALCICVPGYIIVTKSAPFMFSFLWGATLYGFLVLRFVDHTNLCQIWKFKSVLDVSLLKPILIRWVLASIGMLVFIYFYDIDRMFYLPRTRPEILPMIAFFYPLFSALPQEFIFCSFFFARFAPFFGKAKGMVWASAIIFAYAHILYLNPVAPVLSLLGGLIFASTYLKSKSLALVTLEHGLYGISLFVTGLGWYFYSGAVN